MRDGRIYTIICEIASDKTLAMTGQWVFPKYYRKRNKKVVIARRNDEAIPLFKIGKQAINAQVFHYLENPSIGYDD